MSTSTYGLNARSLYLEKPRPVVARQRSNSLPPWALINIQEAGMMFSAAEKATARRKKRGISVDSPLTPPDSPKFSPLIPPESLIQQQHKPIPSPLRQVVTFGMCSSSSEKHTSAPTAPTAPKPSGSRDTPSPILIPESILQKLPVSPLSPKKQIVSPSLKNYADGLLQFTQTKLISTIPELTVASPVTPSRHQSTFSLDAFTSNFNDFNGLNEQSSIVSSIASFPLPPAPQYSFPFRPQLESRFSDWSTTSEAADAKHTSVAPQLDFDSVLLSPDSFFGGDIFLSASLENKSHPPSQLENAKRCSEFSMPSSETYDPPVTPPMSYEFQQPAFEDTEISYFTNYTHYIDSNTWSTPEPENDQPLLSAHDSVIIDISPFAKSPVAPPSVLQAPPLLTRSAAATIIQRVVQSAPLLNSGMPPCAIKSSTSTSPMPNILIGGAC